MAEILETNEVIEVAHKIGLLIPLVKDMKLDEYIATINKSEAILPLYDLTFYVKNMKTGTNNKRLASSLLKFQKTILEIEKELKQ